MVFRGAARDVAEARGVGGVLVSIAHCRTYATAYAMALGRSKPPPPADPA